MAAQDTQWATFTQSGSSKLLFSQLLKPSQGLILTAKTERRCARRLKNRGRHHSDDPTKLGKPHGALQGGGAQEGGGGQFDFIFAVLWTFFHAAKCLDGGNSA